LADHWQCKAQDSLSNPVVGQTEAYRRRNPAGGKSKKVSGHSLLSTYTDFSAQHARDDRLVSRGLATLHEVSQIREIYVSEYILCVGQQSSSDPYGCVARFAG
jgi:hypothetical protein